MPGKNIIKLYQSDSFYHVYNRGVNKQIVFADEQDYTVFLHLLKRLLGKTAEKDNLGRAYSWHGDQLELLAFCLMPNHFHLLWYQYDIAAITETMRSLITAYVMYFNKKYHRVGPLFQQRFRASQIDNDSYLLHISRYLHLNPDDYERWPWSSLPYYNGRYQAEWIKPRRITELFDTNQQYLDFIADYKDYRDSLQLIKSEIDY